MGTIVAGVVIVLDQPSKALVRHTMAVCLRSPRSGCDHVALIGPFGILRIQNEGAGMGFGRGLALWTVAATLGVVLPLFLARRFPGDALVAVGAGLLVGGALGNLVDRIASGGVTDFLSIEWSNAPGQGIAINVADIAMLAGVVLATVALYKAVSGGIHGQAAA